MGNRGSGGPLRLRESCGPPCTHWMVISPDRATGWSTTPSGTVPDRGSAPRSPKGRPFLVNRRMNKSQQMRWSRRGADLMLQVRSAVYNGTLGTGFGQRFQPANDPLPQAAVAA